MRALTLTQPWAGLVASGIKLVENRPRSMIKREDFGKPFAIHASREIDEDVYDKIEQAAPELQLLPSIMMVGTALSSRPAPEWYRLSRITSAVIGVATVVDAIAIDGWYEDAIATALERCGVDPDQQLRFTFGPVVYVLRDVRALAEPVPCRGWQGFWTPTIDIVARVEEQLR